jgi:hypothetical protein
MPLASTASFTPASTGVIGQYLLRQTSAHKERPHRIDFNAAHFFLSGVIASEIQTFGL